MRGRGRDSASFFNANRYNMMRKWADEATKTAVWEVYKFIHVNTVAPFGTFRTKIRKWKKIV